MEILSENMIRHDRHQMETIFIYPFNSKEKKSVYNVDTYFFLPENLGINPDSYDRKAFFSDLMRYTRLKTPSMTFDSILSGTNSPFAKLARSVARLKNSPDQKAVRNAYAERVKMFCSIMKSAIRDEGRTLAGAASRDDFAGKLDEHFKSISGLLHKFRKLKKALQEEDAPDDAMRLFCHADEFLSLSLCNAMQDLWEALEKHGGGNSAAQDKIYRVIERENDYRKACGYPSVAKKNGNNAELLYRQSTLKKVMASVLFLKSARRRDGVLLDNVFLGLAAGVAMVFATAVAFAYRLVWLNDFTASFFVLVVFAYMGKDRIKNLLQLYLQRKLESYHFDFKTTMTSWNGGRIGCCRESMMFVPEESLPKKVVRMRDRSFIGDLENNRYREQIMLYRKQIELESSPVGRFFEDFSINGVVDIMRLNVEHFLKKMDNPNKSIVLCDGKGKLMRQKAKRVYHVNVIVCYGLHGKTPKMRRFRLVLTQNGIQCIEAVKKTGKNA